MQGKKLSAASSSSSPQSASSSPLLYARLPVGLPHIAAAGTADARIGSCARPSPLSAGANASESGVSVSVPVPASGAGREFGVEFGYVSVEEGEDDDGDVATFYCSDEDSLSSASEPDTEPDADPESGPEREGYGNYMASGSPHQTGGPTGGNYNDPGGSEPTRRRSRSMVQSRKDRISVCARVHCYTESLLLLRVLLSRKHMYS